MAERATGGTRHEPSLPTDDDLLEALARGREDVPFFAAYFCDRRLHDGQVDWVTNANGTINLLLTGNRWGKTSVCTIRHCHALFYKIGAEHRYTGPDGELDPLAMFRLRYRTIHCAGLYETAEMVWDDFCALVRDNPRLGAWVKQPIPRTKPATVEFINGARWLFRTLGDHGEGIDGNSFYLITIDEAGWEPRLAKIVDNVARIRVADVGGRLDLVGTAKPGLSQEFFEIALRAQAYLGDTRALDHVPESRGPAVLSQGVHIDPAVHGYALDAGVDLEAVVAAWHQRRAGWRVA